LTTRFKQRAPLVGHGVVSRSPHEHNSLGKSDLITPEGEWYKMVSLPGGTCSSHLMGAAKPMIDDWSGMCCRYSTKVLYTPGPRHRAHPDVHLHPPPPDAPTPSSTSIGQELFARLWTLGQGLYYWYVTNKHRRPLPYDLRN